MASRVVVVASVVATVAFVAYTRTLLPGVDLGDTGGFQAAVLWPETSARQAYPLYYTTARPFVRSVAADDPARGLNLFSALCAALASGVLTGVVAQVTRSAAGGAVAGLLLAFSYTFWTQAVIAEVYALHLLVVGCCLAALAAWEQRPTTERLAVALAVYALGFGNHLSMILLLIPCGVFVVAASQRPADVLRPRIVMMAIGIAAAGALQYVPQFLAVWTSIDAPERWTTRLAAFWFDVTKSDWRESMVLGIRSSHVADRVAMLAFDARQQFGVPGLVAAAVGTISLWTMSRAWALLVVLAYVVNTAFAFTYNVGDPHVFFLPSHYFAAFAAGAAVAAASRRIRDRRAAWMVVAAALLYTGWRGFDTWPAADRHRDRRAERLVARLTAGLDDRDALLATRLNWQVENALLYETRYRLRHVTWTRLDDVLVHFPLLVRDNHASGRDVVLTAAGVPRIMTAFGPLFPIVPDPVPRAISLGDYAGGVRPGALYVLALLTPPRDETLSAESVDAAVASLTGGRTRPVRDAAYQVLIGRAGEAAVLHRAESRPFRATVQLPEGAVHVRMDAWIAFETFRRGGFGHVLLDHRPVLTVERGVSLFVAGAPEPYYDAGIYATQPRFRIPAADAPQRALLH